jgi:hypothetical protein
MSWIIVNKDVSYKKGIHSCNRLPTIYLVTLYKSRWGWMSKVQIHVGTRRGSLSQSVPAQIFNPPFTFLTTYFPIWDIKKLAKLVQFTLENWNFHKFFVQKATKLVRTSQCLLELSKANWQLFLFFFFFFDFETLENNFIFHFFIKIWLVEIEACYWWCCFHCKAHASFVFFLCR